VRIQNPHRISVLTPVIVALALTVPLCGAQTIHIEAEAAELSGPNLKVMGAPSESGPDVSAAATSGSGSKGIGSKGVETAAGHEDSTPALKFSGTGYISGFKDPADRAIFKTKVEKGGLYVLSIAYHTQAHRGYEIEVNDLRIAGLLAATKGDCFTVQRIGVVELNSGQNTIAVDKGWGFFDLDYIELAPAGAQAAVVRPPFQPSDPKATSAARALLTRLDDAYGKTTMLGVYKDRDAKYVLVETGVRPSIMGGDLLAYSPQEVAHGAHPDGEVERLIARSREGYAITLSWHWCSPSGLLETKEEPWWKGFYTEATTFDIAKAMADPDSADHAALLSDIDTIAVQLRKLQDANVPVLWRPLHEAEGGWFWWGAKGPQPFVQLWQLLHDRLTVTDGIHNLLWVYTSEGNPKWYPGDGYVDIVGIDQYPKDLRDPQNGLWNSLQTQYAGRKLLAISEFGGVPDVPRMQRIGESWSYAVSWSDALGPKKNSPEELKRIYTSSGVETQVAPVGQRVTIDPPR